MRSAVYRQRFTEIGYIGVALGIGGPSLSAYLVFLCYSERLVRAQFGPAPDLQLEAIIIGALAGAIGWVMLLIGREHYPYSAAETQVAGSESEI